ncbi:hypothetical protein [Shewanella sp. YLB-07]|nr:hypothetical protein [Shewanella sp. YLB-07]MPY26585.1 hypothetical protein [Shewanella sp. YLB-07]
MNTHLKNGTGTSGFLKGIDKISRELFGHYSKLEYQGWRKHPPSFSTGVTIPRLEWIKDSIGRESAVWLNIGWYKYDKDSMSYIRKGGHWVTVVGYNHGKLIIHDPAPRAGQDFSNEYVSVHHLVKGRLIGKKSGLPTSAVGYLSLGEGMHIKGSVGFSVVDGVVRLIL